MSVVKMTQDVKQKIQHDSGSVHARLLTLRESRLCIDQRTFAGLVGISQSVLSKWERGKYRPPALALMKIGDISAEDRLWWYEQAGPKFAEKLKAAQAKEGKGTDPVLLLEVVEAVQAAIDKVKQALPRMKQMEIVAKVYDYWRGKGQHDPLYVAELVARAIEPLNRKVSKL
jgi:DNA-binding transcriptional regulator YiaG